MNLTLLEKEHLVDNIWAFRFRPEGVFEWTAGQYIRVELPHDSPDQEGTKRWFTNSAAPYEKIMQITTRITQSTFKRALSLLEPGDNLAMIENPDGDFVWQNSDLPILFVAGGIGITPFRSILRQRAHDDMPLAVTLIYGGRGEEGLPFRDEIRDWREKDSRFKVFYATGEPLSAAKLHELYPDINESLVYVSGPEAMVEVLSTELKDKGLLEDRLKRDDFPNYNPENY